MEIAQDYGIPGVLVMDSTILWYLQCINNGDTTVLHWAMQQKKFFVEEFTFW